MIRSVFFCLALILMPLSAHGQDVAQRIAWNTPAEPFTVIDNVHFVGTDELGIFLITTPEGHILIDGGLPETAPLVAASIRALGFKVEDVHIILNTHAHVDHAGGLAELKAETGARLLASAGDRPALEHGRHFGLTNYGLWHFPPVSVDDEIGDGDTVTLGGVTLTAHLTPGHTQGCTTWTLSVHNLGHPMSVMVFCSASVGGNKFVGNTEYPHIVADYRRSFDALERLPVDVFLANHVDVADLHERRARQLAGDTSAFIDPTSLPSVIAGQRAAFESALAEQTGAQ